VTKNAIAGPTGTNSVDFPIFTTKEYDDFIQFTIDVVDMPEGGESQA
jgi:hypothetical protein